jgi:hypothetical protein
MAILHGYLPFKKIGIWQEQRGASGHDSGFYVEYQHAPEGSPRFAQVSTSLLWEEDTRALACHACNLRRGRECAHSHSACNATPNGDEGRTMTDPRIATIMFQLTPLQGGNDMLVFSYQDCRENPYRLVSLWEMLHIYADKFIAALHLISKLVQSVHEAAEPFSFSEEELKRISHTLSHLKEILQQIELKVSIAAVERIEEKLAESRIMRPVLDSLLSDLVRRIPDELRGVNFLLVPFRHQQYYSTPMLFGEDVFNKFSRTIVDIEEAGKCLALGRYTATVFHLMRVMEAALQEFGNKLGVPFVTIKQWQNILDEANKAIKAMDHRLPLTKAYAELAAHLYNVKVAWRNKVMHPKETYTEEEAEDIIRNVRTFMVNLAQVM